MFHGRKNPSVVYRQLVIGKRGSACELAGLAWLCLVLRDTHDHHHLFLCPPVLCAIFGQRESAGPEGRWGAIFYCKRPQQRSPRWMVPVNAGDLFQHWESGWKWSSHCTTAITSSSSSAVHTGIRMPFNDEDHPRNFISKIAKYPRVINIPNSITYLPNALDAMVDLILQRRTGTLNLVNPGIMVQSTVELAL